MHREHFESLFVEVLQLCGEAGLVKLHHVALDGTKVKANASKHKAMSYGRMVAEEKRLREEVDRLLAAASGSGDGGDGFAACQAECAQGPADEGVEASRRGGGLAPSGEDAERADRDLPLKQTRAKPNAQPRDDAQGNFTDPESSIIKGSDGFVQAYNAQLAVDEETQVIVAQGVTNQPPDSRNLRPMLARAVDDLGVAPKNATADAGYWNQDVEAQARELGVEAWVSPQSGRSGASAPGCSQAEADPQTRMRSRLSSAEGRALYARRKAVVEPVNGQIKHAGGFRRFSFRGLEAVGYEWALISLCQNLLKLFAYGTKAPPASTTTRQRQPHDLFQAA